MLPDCSLCYPICSRARAWADSNYLNANSSNNSSHYECDER